MQDSPSLISLISPAHITITASFMEALAGTTWPDPSRWWQGRRRDMRTLTHSSEGKTRRRVERGLAALEWRPSTTMLSLKSAETALRKQLRQIAAKELSRRRRRLGLLTNEQELAIESLLDATVDCISKPVFERAHQCCAAGDERRALALCSVFQMNQVLLLD